MVGEQPRNKHGHGMATIRGNAPYIAGYTPRLQYCHSIRPTEQAMYTV